MALKVLVIGFGSIGRRHINILQELTEAVVLSCPSGKGLKPPGSPEIAGVKFFENFDQALEAVPDFAIISNPTSHHLETAIKVARAGLPFILEKPVSHSLDGLDFLRQIVDEKAVPVMVGFQLRHHPGYQRLIEIITSGAIGRIFHVSGYVGQYLPDWRPGIDYRQCYSSFKRLGGGVIFDLCHEIDIVMSILGRVTSVACVTKRFSDLEIDSEDMADIIFQHHGFNLSSIHLNYLERTYVWTTRVTGEFGSALWDYGRGFVELILPTKVERWEDPPGFERNDLYRCQMRQWLEVIAGKAEPAVDLTQGIEVTKAAFAAMRSSVLKKHIQL